MFETLIQCNKVEIGDKESTNWFKQCSISVWTAEEQALPWLKQRLAITGVYSATTLFAPFLPFRLGTNWLSVFVPSPPFFQLPFIC